MSKQQRSTLQSGVCNVSEPELAEAEELSTEPYGLSELPAESEDCVPPADAFYAAVSGDDLPAALEAWGLLGAGEQQTFRGDPSTLTRSPTAGICWTPRRCSAPWASPRSTPCSGARPAG